MRFFVIYDFDIPASESVKRYQPPNVRKLWDQTEGDSEYEFSYLGDEWSKGKHRKYCALLTRPQFDEFVRDQAMFAESTETMGSLSEYGWLPAISFRGDADVIQGAYVTPIPTDSAGNDRENLGERDWQRIRQAILSIYR